MPIVELDDLLACLVLDDRGEDRFGAANLPMDYRRVFGGQLLAQCIAVAARTTPGKHVQSLHATFPREGDIGQAITYRVERFQDGRTFAGRRIVGEQAGRLLVVAQVSLHVEEEGLVHGVDAPDVPPPERCPAIDLGMIPWETRVVDGVDLRARDVGPPRYSYWMKTPPLGEDATVHAALLAHASDLSSIGTALRPHAGLSEADAPGRLVTAVTSHTLWLHTRFRIDEWTLVDQQSPRAAGARAFGQGRVFDRRGALVASFAQESLVRETGSA